MRKKRKRILKVVLPLVISLFVIYHLVFYTVDVYERDEKILEAEYGDYILVSFAYNYWERFFPSLPDLNMFSGPEAGGGSGDALKTIIFFRWDADEIKKNLKKEFGEKMEELGSNSAVVNYTYDEKTFDVGITLDEFNKEYYDALAVYDELLEEHSFIRRFCKDDSWLNPSNYNVISSKKEEPETEIKKYAYDEQEVDLLNKIITSSLEQKSFDLEDEDKIQGDSEDRTGGHICYLDLSDYNYITGKLDLSGFPKLKYVLIRGMKISEVVLPESLEYIDEKSFAYCESLEKIVIPENVKSFENPVFSGCKNLKEIIFEGDAPEISWEKEDIFGKVPEDLVIYRKKSAKGWQKKCWDKYDVRIIY